MTAPRSTDLAVVGAGPGGYAAAFLAADLGKQVTLIDPEEHPGGVCLYRGCIPSKALLHVARIIDEAAEAQRFGVRFVRPEIDLDGVRAYRQEVVDRLTGGLGQLAARRGVDYVRGRARFVGAGTLEIALEEGGTERLAYRHAILASGSRAALPPGFPAPSRRVWTSREALSLPEVPGRLLVVGGGYIGLELGSVYAALGSRVTVVEMRDALLPGVDPDLVRPLARRLAGKFEAVHLSTRVRSIEDSDSVVSVVLEGSSGEDARQTFDAALAAVGRRVDTSSLGLENTRVEVDDDGFVRVDAQRRTAEDTVFAIGDITGPPMLAHKATHEGRVAAEVVAGRPAAYDPAAIPVVVYTDPEIAWCGLTEVEARERGRSVVVARFPWAASGRALTLGRDDGLTKLMIDADTERVLCVGLCGPGAGELIAEGVLAVEMAATAGDLALTVHPHPTLSETLMEAAEAFHGSATHVHRPRRR